MIVPPGRPSSAFRSSLDRFHDASSYRKGRCRREENDYRDLGPGKYDRPSFMELQQTRPKTIGSIPGGSSFHRSTVTRRGSNGHEGRKDHPHIGPGTYHRASRMFFAKNEAIMFLPGSRRGFHSFLSSGRSKTLMDDAVLFKTARPAGQHLGPGSYDLPSTLTNGIRPNTAPMTSVAHHSDRSLPESSRSDGTSMAVAYHQRRTADASKAPRSESWTGGQQPGGQQQQHFYFREERAADVEAVRALPALR